MFEEFRGAIENGLTFLEETDVAVEEFRLRVEQSTTPQELIAVDVDILNTLKKSGRATDLSRQYIMEMKKK